MKRYTVTWSPEAEAYLAKLWVDFKGQRSAITAAANTIDRLLAEDPAKSLELHEGLRSLDIAPLHVLFEIQAGPEGSRRQSAAHTGRSL